jgi:hypothetical protein
VGGEDDARRGEEDDVFFRGSHAWWGRRGSLWKPNATESPSPEQPPRWLAK